MKQWFSFISTIHFSDELFPVLADEPPEEDDSAEPPTPEGIEANTELQAEQGDNLTIACDRRHHATVYRATLERRLHGQDWGVIGVCKKVGGLVEVGLVGEEYSDRGRLSCTDTLDVSLRLTGVVQQDGGLYRCTFSTEAGVQASTVLLSVSPTGTKADSMHSSAITYSL